MVRIRVKPEIDSATSLQKRVGVAEGEVERVELEGRRAFFKLRRIWSGWIIAWVTTLILFNVVLTALVGSGMLNFVPYQWFITAVTVETFLQIVGLGYVAVRFLFSSQR